MSCLHQTRTLPGGQTCLLPSPWPPPPNSRNSGPVGEKKLWIQSGVLGWNWALAPNSFCNVSSHLPPGAHHRQEHKKGQCVYFTASVGLTAHVSATPGSLVSSWGAQQTPAPSPPMVCASPHLSIPGSHKSQHTYSGAECQPLLPLKAGQLRETGSLKAVFGPPTLWVHLPGRRRHKRTGHRWWCVRPWWGAGRSEKPSKVVKVSIEKPRNAFF